MPIHYYERPEDHLVEIHIRGEVTENEFDQYTQKFESFIKNYAPVKLLEVIENLDGMDKSLLWKSIKYDIQHLKEVKYCAVVSDISWLTPLSKAIGAFSSTKLKTFRLDEVTDARDWLLFQTK